MSTEKSASSKTETWHEGAQPESEMARESFQEVEHKCVESEGVWLSVSSLSYLDLNLKLKEG